MKAMTRERVRVQLARVIASVPDAEGREAVSVMAAELSAMGAARVAAVQRYLSAPARGPGFRADRAARETDGLERLVRDVGLWDTRYGHTLGVTAAFLYAVCSDGAGGACPRMERPHWSIARSLPSSLVRPLLQCARVMHAAARFRVRGGRAVEVEELRREMVALGLTEPE